MPRIKHSPEQIIAKLRKAEILLADGKNMDEVAKALQITKHTYYSLEKRVWKAST